MNLLLFLTKKNKISRRKNKENIEPSRKIKSLLAKLKMINLVNSYCHLPKTFIFPPILSMQWTSISKATTQKNSSAKLNNFVLIKF